MAKGLAYIWLGIASIFRVIPHVPNFSPVMSSALFAGAKLDRKSAVFSILGLMVVTDIILSQIHGTSVFGWWTLFTFSGVVAVVLLGRAIKENFSGARFFGCALGGSLLFWTWTNLGTWMTSGLYSLDGAGFIACYAAAIPFLKTALLGDLIWSLVLFVSYDFAQKRIAIGSTSAA